MLISDTLVFLILFQKYSDNEVGVLIIVTLGGIIIFLVLVMLALLNFKLCCTSGNTEEMDTLLLGETDQESEEAPIFTIDRNFKGETQQFSDDGYNENNEIDGRFDIEHEHEKNSRVSRNLFKRFKYTRSFFR